MQLRTIVNRPTTSFADRDVRQGMTSATAGPVGCVGPSTGHSGNDDQGSYSEREREVSLQLICTRGSNVLIYV